MPLGGGVRVLRPDGLREKVRKNLLEDGDHDFAMARAYYAMFYAASAALLAQEIHRARHSGVIAAFGENLVKRGQFTVAQQGALQAAFRDRSAVDTAGVFPRREEVVSRPNRFGTQGK